MSNDYYGGSIADDYDALGDDLIPHVMAEGRGYVGFIKKAQAGQSKSGKRKIFFVVQATEGPEAGYEAADNWYWSPESPKAAQIMAQNLSRVGATPEWIKTERPSWEAIAERIEGVPVQFDITYDGEFNGAPNVRVAIRKALGPRQGAAEAAGAFDLGGQAPAAQAAPQQAPQAQQAQQQAPADPWAVNQPPAAQQAQAGGWPSLG